MSSAPTQTEAPSIPLSQINISMSRFTSELRNTAEHAFVVLTLVRSQQIDERCLFVAQIRHLDPSHEDAWLRM
ncbi:hypothetical protein AMS68_006452 [Peltaster fructicola]|uniref:Uncharacterized protein n=1 Tax=Peltaster fructicola TaxID=286661 RepID=A0A6H0Y1Z6_9PEZI|nr:hypothetical protein AMS68_006452 [Peltaster fructicola]